ncbi:sigma factor G inhibitor Gin [Paenibacillus roseipurpureus]|uniref:Sigma factor G inhibitor Gin n=1 Tax=Paenibacillus roseopurpureus TaxID=2918901 RepID=A0AA96LN05_9BACL|nr:sigma factor G inhibitor Gin [Paenibacillus sp. MBLB1832]WNR44745.1 sigma factor G inhibitor Gin [Paenibacillus sp. MBLB1832]
MEENRFGLCMICEQQKFGGIYIVTAFICDACNNEIVKTNVSDGKYTFFVNQMRKAMYLGNVRQYMN